jgi:hypothetical protein
MDPAPNASHAARDLVAQCAARLLSDYQSSLLRCYGECRCCMVCCRMAVRCVRAAFWTPGVVYARLRTSAVLCAPVIVWLGPTRAIVWHFEVPH